MVYLTSFSVTLLLAITYHFSNKKRKKIDKKLVIVCFIIFLFYQSKDRAVIGRRTGHFQGLVGFNAKDFKCVLKDYTAAQKQ